MTTQAKPSLSPETLAINWLEAKAESYERIAHNEMSEPCELIWLEGAKAMRLGAEAIKAQLGANCVAASQNGS